MAEAVLVWLQQIAWRFGHILVGWRNVCQARDGCRARLRAGSSPSPNAPAVFGAERGYSLESAKIDNHTGRPESVIRLQR